VCVPPLVTVNCKDDDGRLVGVNNTVDPNSNSGRGNKDDDICDRLRQPPPPFPGVCP